MRQQVWCRSHNAPESILHSLALIFNTAKLTIIAHALHKSDRKKSNGLTITNYFSLQPSCSTVTLLYKHNTVQSASHSVHMNGGCCNLQFVVDQVAPGQVFSRHFSFLLSLSFNQCSKLIHSSNSGAILLQQLSAFLNTTPPLSLSLAKIISG